MRTIPRAIKALLRASGLAALVLLGLSQPALTQLPIAQQFVGTWRLVTLEVDGKPDPRFGLHPIGQIYYDATGHMAAQIMPDRPRPSWPSNTLPTPEQAKDAVTGYVAYFGRYTIDEHAGTVSHHREGSLNLNVIDLVRRYEFSTDGHLILVPLDNPSFRLVWERAQ